jgi:putative transcriptional regulator
MNFHPDREWLEQFAAGSLGVAHALCISVHLTHCATCRREVDAMQTLGGVLLASLGSADLNASLLDTVFAAIDSQPDAAPVASQSTATTETAAVLQTDSDVPAPLRKLIPDGYDALAWSRLLPSLQLAVIDVGDPVCQVSLQRVRAGGRIAMHDHRGTELTLVLRGGFSDDRGVYEPGDFLVREPNQQHQPIVHQNGECICLAVLDAPVRFTGPLMRWVNPFIRL